MGADEATIFTTKKTVESAEPGAGRHLFSLPVA